MLNSEKSYYKRHMALPGFTTDTQLRLREAKVLVIGVGGLGCPVSTYLAGAGVGQITLCDEDIVSVSNLHRQILFGMNCIGERKVSEAAKRIREQNPYIRIKTIAEFMSEKTLMNQVSEYDVVVDCTDNHEAKFAINDACSEHNVPLVYGSIFQYEGQVSVFHYGNKQAFTYRDLYQEAPPSRLSKNCAEAGVIGVLPGIIGTLQANEVIKILTGLGSVVSGTLLKYSALDSSMKRLEIQKRPKFKSEVNAQDMPNSIPYDEYLEAKRLGQSIALLDVRTVSERKSHSIGGVHIPIDELVQRAKDIPTSKKIVVYCQSGLRATRAALYLSDAYRDKVIYTLTEGACNIQQTHTENEKGQY